MMTYRCESFGMDCLGNVTGYRVMQRGPRGFVRVLAQFVANLYSYGSHNYARAAAIVLATTAKDWSV